MKATVDVNGFCEAIGWCTRSYNLRGDKECVELEVSPKGVGILRHHGRTTFESSPFSVLDVDLEEDVKLALDGRYLKNLVGAIKNSDKATLTFNSKSEVSLASTLGNFSIPVVDVPLKRVPKWMPIAETSGGSLFSILRRLARVSESASGRATATFTSAIRLRLEKDEPILELTSTDKFALAVVKTELSLRDGEQANQVLDELRAGILLPYEAAVAVSPPKGLEMSTTIVAQKLNSGGLRFGYEFADGKVFLTSLMQEAYPDVERVIAGAIKVCASSAVAETKSVLQALSVINSLSWDEIRTYLAFCSGHIKVENESGKSSIKVPVEREESAGDEKGDVRLAFSRSVIANAFSVIETANVQVKWGGHTRAILLYPVLDDGGVSKDAVVCLARS